VIIIKNILYGFLIGLGKIIPGVSGSIIAIILGVYDRAIDSIGNIFQNFKANVKYLCQLSVGIMLAIIVFSNIIMYLLNNQYTLTMSIFVILIILSIQRVKPLIIKKTPFTLSLLLSLLLFFIPDIINVKIPINNFSLFVMGIIEALTMIIPGISGTAIFISLNYYDYILEMFAYVHIFKLTIYLSGTIISIFILSKLISKLIKNKNILVQNIFYGLSISTIIIMIQKIIFSI